MSEHYKATSAKNPANTEVIVARDKKTGDVKSIKVGGGPVELTEAEHDSAAKYLNLRKVTDVEAERKKYEATLPVQQPGEDTAAAGPLFASSANAVTETEIDQIPVEPIRTEGPKGR